MTVTNWGDNPSNLPALLVYTPSNLASNPPIVVGLHPCGGSGPQFMAEFDIPAFADELGFPVLYPTSGVEDGINCWDCWSNKSLSHNGGGESQGVAAMVSWALKHFNGDPSRVFAIGASSGGMFGNVLAATYPNLFAGIASWSGVPAGCFAGATSSTPANPDQSCATGAKARTLSAAQWAALALGSYPGYTGARPKMLITHGTADTVVSILNFNAQLAQWSTVLGLTFTRNITGDPTANWKRIVYGDGTKLIGFEVAGGGHIPPFQDKATFQFFGLLGGTATTTVGTTTSATTTTTSNTGTPSGGTGCSTAKYGQCGGIGFTGCTTCASGSTCKFSNDYYSQCL
ncbi:carbohydrate esterase family 1 protein [Mycena belliarum]|uniref:Carboxylic ester hydrolase n=1 Tax=Mycena belliarum TaxID=1033014 RepID=A0AAD6U274_9AGAR|nr:carbohydrate esterase family 1 protein [Mycena belliae]